MSEFDDKLNELLEIENKMPTDYHTLITKIDVFIFCAQQGFNKATELYIIASIMYSEAYKAHRQAIAKKILDAKENKMSITLIKDYAKSKSVFEEIELIRCETAKEIARYHRDKWSEWLNTFKKIKSDNGNMR